MLYLIIQALINGVMNGAIYALIAVGITVIFGVMRLINFASGAYVGLSNILDREGRKELSGSSPAERTHGAGVASTLVGS